MSAKSARGAKRKCQNEDCLAPFYDLGRTNFECPACGTPFDHDLEAGAIEAQTARYPARRQPRVLPIVASQEPEGADVIADDDLLVDAVDDDADDAEAPGDDLLEDEEDDALGDTLEIPATEDRDET